MTVATHFAARAQPACEAFPKPESTTKADPDARFHELLQAHQNAIYSIALRMLGDSGIAEEVAQDVFVELYRTLPRLESDAHALFWLRRTATHRSTDALRRRKVRPESHAEQWEDSFELAFLGRGDVKHPNKVVLSARVEKALLSLPEQQRAAVILRYQEELTPEEISKLTGDGLPTVKSNLQRGMALLRRKSQVLLKEFIRG